MTNKHEMAKRRAELQRQAAAKQKVNTRNWVIAGVAVVLVAAAVIAIVSAASGSSKPAAVAEVPTGAAADAVTAKVTGVTAAVSDQVAAGSVIGQPTASTSTAITQDGKPQVLYIGAEFCPYCAAERWAVVNALSRFGTFSNLSLTHSASADVYPNTPTFTFHGASFTSQTIAFAGYELQKNVKDTSGNYATLDTLPPDTDTLWKKITNGGGYPFVDIGGKYIISGATLDPGVLSGLSADQIASKLTDPTSGVTRSIVGAANSIVKAICTLTGNQPAAVCSAPGVQAAKLG